MQPSNSARGASPLAPTQPAVREDAWRAVIPPPQGLAALELSIEPAKGARAVPAIAGTLVSIKQFHDRPEHGPLAKRLTLYSQQRVLDTLLAEKPKVVFVESLYIDHPADKLSQTSRSQVRGIFAGYTPGQQLDPMQEAWLGGVSGAQVYAFMKDDVELRRTTTEVDSASLDLYVNQNAARIQSHGMNAEDESLIMSGRERCAVSIISGWRESNPNVMAALVYGAAHDFTKYANQLQSEVRVVETAPDTSSIAASTVEVLRQRPGMSAQAMSLGNGASGNGKTELDERLERYPGDIAARLQRGTREDLEYVLEKYPKNQEAQRRLGR